MYIHAADKTMRVEKRVSDKLICKRKVLMTQSQSQIPMAVDKDKVSFYFRTEE